MVRRQQARNGRKANLFIPQIRIYSSGRTKCSQQCQGPGHNPPSSSHQGCSRVITEILPQPKSLGVCFPFFPGPLFLPAHIP